MTLEDAVEFVADQLGSRSPTHTDSEGRVAVSLRAVKSAHHGGTIFVAEVWARDGGPYDQGFTGRSGVGFSEALRSALRSLQQGNQEPLERRRRDAEHYKKAADQLQHDVASIEDFFREG